jgi:hypothetical protein
MADETIGGGDTSVSSGSSAVDNTNATAEAQPLELDDNAVIRFKGSDKPIPVKDVRGFQAQFTRASQRAAELERQLQARQAQIQQYERERAAAAQRQSQSQGQSQADVFAALRELPYLDGQTAVQVVEGITNEIRQRDRVLLAALQQMQKMQQVLGRLNETHTNAGFDAKINKWLTDGGYPVEAADLAKEIYLAYEGDNLDQEFPEIFKNRWEQVVRAIEAQRAAKVAQNRRNPFVPGKGGQAGPNRPLQPNPAATAAETADMLWEAMQTGNLT